ncbi:MAG: YunC family protein [Elusimicrobiota bacterium]
MKNIDIDLNGQIIKGIEIKFSKAPLVLAKAKSGFVMCGYLNLETAEKLGDAAAVVRGVMTVEDLLKAKIQGFTSFAAQKGVKEGMTGKEALEKMG